MKGSNKDQDDLDALFTVDTKGSPTRRYRVSKPCFFGIKVVGLLHGCSNLVAGCLALGPWLSVEGSGFRVWLQGTGS